MRKTLHISTTAQPSCSFTSATGLVRQSTGQAPAQLGPASHVLRFVPPWNRELRTLAPPSAAPRSHDDLLTGSYYYRPNRPSKSMCDLHSSASIAATRRADCPVFGHMLSRGGGRGQRRLLRRWRGGGGASVLRRPGGAGALVELQPAPVRGGGQMKSFTESGM